MKGFILSRHWRDTTHGVVIDVWLSTPQGALKLTIPNQQAIFFVEAEQQEKVQLIIAKLVAQKRLPSSSITLQHLALKNIHGQAVMGVYCLKQRYLYELCEALRQHQIIFWEEDIRPPERFLMERFVTASLAIPDDVSLTRQFSHREAFTDKIKSIDYQPELTMLSIDIETSMDAQTLYSIAAYSLSHSVVFMVDELSEERVEQHNEVTIYYCLSPRACLEQFLQWLAVVDPDIIIGWHVVQFDCWVLNQLCEKYRIPFSLGRNQSTPHWRVDSRDADVDSAQGKVLDRKRRYIQLHGRVVLDGIELLRIAFYHFESFSLQFVANALLGKSKLIDHDDRGQAISDLYQQDKVALAQYNLRDCQLVWDIFEETNLLDFAIARSQLTGLPLDKMGGSVASFEYAYLPQLHRKGYVAPSLGEITSDVISPGGYVMTSTPGLYRHVLVLDFKSLYPSIIRTFAIDPYAYWYAQHQELNQDEVVEGYNEAYFSRKEQLLPNIIKDLWSERDKAKKEDNQPLSQAIKIIMNSFYGVLGSTGCRFFDPRVCSSITLRGHDIIQQSQAWIEEQGYQVIYGDTDSLFVWLGENFSDIDVDRNNQEATNDQAINIGKKLAKSLNHWWKDKLDQSMNLESALEIEFETHYESFLMPTIRGSDKGSKKRYAGVINNNNQKELVFKGLETVRNDWTLLAKNFQKTLYEMIFEEQSYQEYIGKVVQQVQSQQHDNWLIYRKRLRRSLAEYSKTSPPHVKAARKLQFELDQPLGKGDVIEYVMTTNGPEPIAYRKSRIDYQHYIDKQMQPIADSILCFLGDSFEKNVQKQIELL